MTLVTRLRGSSPVAGRSLSRRHRQMSGFKFRTRIATRFFQLFDDSVTVGTPNFSSVKSDAFRLRARCCYPSDLSVPAVLLPECVHHRIGFRVDGRRVQRVITMLMRKKPAHCSKAFGPRRLTLAVADGSGTDRSHRARQRCFGHHARQARHAS